jgi:phage terminase small subunit
MKLNDRQEKFCIEYLVDFHATKAAVRAGYSEKTAYSIGSENLKKPEIQERLTELQKQDAESKKITREMVIEEYAKVAFSDIREYYDENNRLHSIKDLSDRASAALAGVEVDELWVSTEAGKEQIGETKKIKRWDKIKALDGLSKVLGYNAPEEIKHSGSVQIIKLPDNGRGN